MPWGGMFLKNKSEAWWLCVLFLSAWLGLTAASVIKPSKAFSELENRFLQTRPEFSWSSLADGSFGQAYEAYIADQFPARDGWVTLKTYAQRLRGMRDMNGIYFGSGGHLLENDGELWAQAGGGTQWAGKKAQAQDNLEFLYSFMDTYEPDMDSVRVLFVPSGSSVLKNRLPAFAPVYPQEQWIRGAAQGFAGRQSFDNPFVELFEILEGHQAEDIYYRTDHHWSMQGAFLAYGAWAESINIAPLAQDDFHMEMVADDFYGTLYARVHAFGKADELWLYSPGNEDISQYLTLEDGEEIQGLYDWNALETRDTYTFFLHGNHGLARIRTEGNEAIALPQRKLMVVGDSFANCFVPFVSLHFSQTIVVDLRYLGQELSALIESEGITDILVMYNVKNFSQDRNVFRLNK